MENRSKMEATREGVWALLFDRFQCVLRAKLGSKMEARWCRKGRLKSSTRLQVPPEDRPGGVGPLVTGRIFGFLSMHSNCSPDEKVSITRHRVFGRHPR